MTQATSLTSRWYSSPRTITAHGFDPGEKPYWKVEGVTIRLGDFDTLQLTADRHGASGSMRVEVGDGELRFPLEDLVPLVLERLDISELAQMIMGNEEARRAILTSLAAYYNDHYIEDADRRFWIAKVQAAIHSKKLDEIAFAMARIENGVAQMGYDAMRDIAFGNVLSYLVADLMRFLGCEWRQAQEIGDALARRHDALPPDKGLVDFRPYVNALGSGANAWNDARDHWRAQVEVLFANVEVPEEPATQEAFA